MKAVYINEFGTGDNLELRQVADPEPPPPGRVLVRVRAAGLNRADLLQRRGLYMPPSGYKAEIPGLEFSGEIVEIGKDVAAWAIGDRVFGITAGEAQAEFLTIDAGHLAAIPENLNFVEAAAVPEAFITAQDAIFTLGRLSSGETILIHAVGSGVGLAALQLALAAGAIPIGTSRTAAKLDQCKGFGMTAGIDTASFPNFSKRVGEITDGRGASVILDLVGAGYFDQNLRSLATQGRLIMVGLTSGRKSEIDLGMVLYKRATIIGTVLRARSSAEKAEVTQTFIGGVLPLLAAGVVKPNVDRVFHAADVLAAYEYLESNESFGKVVLEF